MKKTITILALFLFGVTVYAQKKTTTSAVVSFDATTAKDALPKAENKTVIGSIDTQTGEVAFEAAVKNFSFANPRMQEHFNGANWFKSDEFPTISFTGKLEKMKSVNFNKNGTYKVTVKGDMKIRDVVKNQKIEGTITVNNGKISVASGFSIKLSEFDIKGQPIESGKVSSEPKVTVTAEFQ